MISKFKMPFIIIFLSSLFIIFMSAFWGMNASFVDDDIYWGMYSIDNETVFDCLKFNFITAGGYFGLFVSKLLSWGIPHAMGLHPSDFIGIPEGIIKGIFTVITLLILTKFSSIYFKNKLNFALIYTVIAIYYVLDIFFQNAQINLFNFDYYKYSFSLIFYGIFIYYLYLSATLRIKKINWFQLIAVSLCGYIAGTSIELIYTSLAILTILLIIYNVIALLISKIVKNKNFKKSLVFNLDKKFFIPVICLFIGIILFVTSDKYNPLICFNNFSGESIRSILKDFSISFLNIYVVKYWMYWATSIILTVLTSIIAIKRNEFKKVLFPLFMQISLIAVIYSLITGNNYYVPNLFWLSYGNVKFLITILILYPYLIMVSYLLKNLTRKSNDDTKHIVLGFNNLILVLLVLELMICKVNFHNIFHTNSFFYDIKKSYYICEKMIRFYSLQDKIPVLPAEYIKDILGIDREGNVSLFQAELTDKKTNLYKENMYFKVYYSKIYKNQQNIPESYYVTDSAMEKFESDGGSFTEDELNKLKFSNLFNENFVLNKDNI